MVRNAAGAVAVLGALMGCSDAAKPVDPGQDPSALFWRVTLNQQAINLSSTAPHDTFRLVATPRGLDGEALDGAVSTRFASAEPGRVLVGPDGLVRGVQAAARVPVVVTMTLGELTHQDTAVVSITEQLPPSQVSRLVLEPFPIDSAKTAFDQTGLKDAYHAPSGLVARVFDAAGAEIPDLAVWIESSDPLAARYDNLTGALELRRPGPVTFYASTVASGTIVADTLDYTIGLPVVGAFTVQSQVTFDGTAFRFIPSVLTIGVGGHVVWAHATEEPVYGVTFEDPTNVAADTVLGPSFGCGAGNTAGDLAPWGDASGNPFTNWCTRRFPVAGSYRFHSEALGVSATVVVVDESETVATSAP